MTERKKLPAEVAAADKALRPPTRRFYGKRVEEDDRRKARAVSLSDREWETLKAMAGPIGVAALIRERVLEGNTADCLRCDRIPADTLDYYRKRQEYKEAVEEKVEAIMREDLTSYDPDRLTADAEFRAAWRKGYAAGTGETKPGLDAKKFLTE